MQITIILILELCMQIAYQSLWKAFVFLTFLDGTGDRLPPTCLPGSRQADADVLTHAARARAADRR
ncbi:protein of unknown function (plasmid) [Cupriavidus taiwanensis]|uniref:Uncharacterized protein n=1 Tax=Cupriavidus taiwanensis TaxID=164546 RepID=A0A375DMG3_9BURK|nr:protein of unknown function [Cupriavidus taiwanensis]SOZ10891.1 protein of unknown function [Cupriavidus taiwanensis]SPC20551.1 hypothetical protein CT19431_MP80401 [Cupriavidus taiwanensis]SPC21253.1 protein of unknown function [Cupriavidus taiwanensis]SPD55394.1 protein of unknown function [Cupriavidus taiwanensis]